MCIRDSFTGVKQGMNAEKKIAVVTGASRGIGRAIALELEMCIRDRCCCRRRCENGKRYGWSECRTCEGADELSGTDQKAGKRDGCVVERNWNL